MISLEKLSFDEYLSEMKWFHQNVSNVETNEKELLDHWNKMTSTMKDFSLRSIRDHNIIARVAIDAASERNS